jgi:hypothetical protein
MRSLPDLIYEWAKKGAPKDGQKIWVNDYPNGFIFLLIIAFAIFFVAFIVPFFRG